MTAPISRCCSTPGCTWGKDDLPPRDARKLMGADAAIGFSSHNVNQLCAVLGGEPVDYVALWPIFATASKRNPDPVVGVEEVRAVALLEKPLVAIGGITTENALDVLRAGADSIAVIGGLLPAVFTAQSIRQRMEQWQQLS